MSKELKYEEFFFGRENRIVNIEELNGNNYLIYQGHMFCPECHKAELSYVTNTSKTPHLRTKTQSFHFESCPYNYDMASIQATKTYFTNLSDEQIKNKLNSMMRYLCTEKNKRNESLNQDINHHPMLIKTQKARKTMELRQIKRKSLSGFFDKDEELQLCVFYGKVQLKLRIIEEKTEKGDKTYAFLDLFCKNKKKFSIYFPKSQIPKDIERNKEYYIVVIGEIKQKKQKEEDFKLPFEIGLLNKNCIKYQQYENTN